MPILMLIRIFYFLSVSVIVLGMVMLMEDKTATTHFNNGTRSTELIFNGSQVVFMGLVFFLAGLYVQRKNTDN